MRRLIILMASGIAWAQPPLGTVRELGESCPAGPIAGTRCRRLEVSCDGLKPIRVQLRITPPDAGVERRGTVVMGSGGAGGGFYTGAPPVHGLVKDLTAMEWEFLQARVNRVVQKAGMDRAGLLRDLRETLQECVTKDTTMR